jgi:hypothetical protein
MGISLSLGETKSNIDLAKDAKSNISLSLGETKSNLNLAKEAKGYQDQTWDEATYTWDEAIFPWDNQKLVLNRETKTKVDLTNEPK